MDTDASDPQQVTNGEAKLHSEVSPDGKWLIYASNNFLSKQPINGGEPIKIMKGGGASQPSPDSKQIVFHYFDPNEKEKTPWKTGLKSFDDLTKLDNIDIDSANAIYRWKSDGTGFYYASEGRNQNNILFYSLKDKTSTQITHFDDERIVNMSVSPDGTQIAISKGKAKSEIIKITNFND